MLTLAASGEGIATSIAGTLYTIATADVEKALYVSPCARLPICCSMQVLSEGLGMAPFRFLDRCLAGS